ncbi:RidA family protein [Nonomuraea sp. NPDC050547]|uniref:RidA family protein n=1 Tax=unclassified Nonomuraea TaxID=2593643 RepID=UPI0037A9CC7F
MGVEERIRELGLVLPAPLIPPDGLRLPFPSVRVRGNRAYLSGHGPLLPDWSVDGPAGRVGAEVSVEEGYAAARATGLHMVTSLRAALGDLDRVTAWLRVFGMVNVAPGFTRMPAVINGFSDLIHQLWPEDSALHARSAVGVASLPFGIPVEIEAEVEIDG